MLSRLSRAARWVLWSPARVRATTLTVAGVVAALTLGVITAVARARPPEPSCGAAAAAFAAAFFGGHRDGWTGAVARTVTPAARQSVTGINPEDVPAGPATVTGVEVDGARCAATVTIPAGTIALSVVEHSGQWLVDAWGPS